MEVCGGLGVEAKQVFSERSLSVQVCRTRPSVFYLVSEGFPGTSPGAEFDLNDGVMREVGRSLPCHHLAGSHDRRQREELRTPALLLLPDPFPGVGDQAGSLPMPSLLSDIFLGLILRVTALAHPPKGRIEKKEKILRGKNRNRALVNNEVI